MSNEIENTKIRNFEGGDKKRAKHEFSVLIL